MTRAECSGITINVFSIRCSGVSNAIPSGRFHDGLNASCQSSELKYTLSLNVLTVEVENELRKIDGVAA